MGSRFPDARFPLIQDGSSERPGAVKGAPPGAAKRTLYGEDRSESIAKEGNEAFDFRSATSETETTRVCVLSTIVLFETRGL
jgi:hypothetical protein